MMPCIAKWTAAMSLVAAAACTTSDPIPIDRPAWDAGPVLRLSSDRTPVGGMVAIAIGVGGPARSSVAGLEGRLRFDPGLLRYVGQDPAANAIGIAGRLAATASPPIRISTV